MAKAPSHVKGFTIIELMVTLVVAAILLSIAAPSFNAILQDNRLTTSINSMSASLNLTRSEAIKRGGVPVILCKSNDFDATPSCVAAANWHDGWYVFADDDSDGAIDNGEVLRLTVGLEQGQTLAYAAGINEISYDSRGFISAGDQGTFRLCDDRGINFGRGLVISPSGQVRTADTTDLAVDGC